VTPFVSSLFFLCNLSILFCLLFVIAEKDKETLENKLSASSEALESLNKQMDGLSLKLDSAQETIETTLVKKVDLKSNWCENK
jgi:butyrate kinase